MATFTYQLAYYGWVRLEKDEIKRQRSGEWLSLYPPFCQKSIDGVRGVWELGCGLMCAFAAEVESLENQLKDLTKDKKPWNTLAASAALWDWSLKAWRSRRYDDWGSLVYQVWWRGPRVTSRHWSSLMCKKALRKPICNITNRPGEVQGRCCLLYKNYWRSGSGRRPTIRRSMIHGVLD